MIQTTYDANGEQRFSFTEAAELVVEYGLKSWKEQDAVSKEGYELKNRINAHKLPAKDEDGNLTISLDEL